VARLDLTPSARERLEQWRDRRVQATATALARLPADERTRLGEALSTIARIAADLPEGLEAPEPSGETPPLTSARGDGESRAGGDRP
jgi:hypothetical protein